MFIVLEKDSYWVTGQGHGYYDHQVDYIKAHEIETEEKLTEWIESHTKYQRYNKFKVYRAEELQINQKVSFEIKKKS